MIPDEMCQEVPEILLRNVLEISQGQERISGLALYVQKESIF